jgi:hypothetical protein
MAGFMPAIHVFTRAVRKDVDGTQLGLARVARTSSAASRVNPTCGDKPGHDG